MTDKRQHWKFTNSTQSNEWLVSNYYYICYYYYYYYYYCG